MSSINETSRKLRALAGKEVNTEILTTPYRAKSPEAQRILHHLWNFSLDSKTLPDIESSEYVSVTECTDLYSESEAVANTVLSLLTKGYRRREIAVIAGNMENYRGIIDSTFEKAEIPYFMSESTDLVSEPLISLILSAFAIKFKNWNTADVISYLKTGLTGIDQKDIDIFEIYVSTWKISGNRFFDEFWSMNPDGYSADLSERGIKILETANKVKSLLTSQLSVFFAALDASKTVSELCDATYEFFKEMRLSQKMEERARRAHSLGNKKAALECAGTHKAFIKVLSDISSAMGGDEMSVEEFASSLKLVLNNTEIGTIPTAADEVILGSASMLRASGIKCAILIGMCDGEFPARVSENSFFSDNEKNVLQSLPKPYNIELSGNTSAKNSEELLHAYRAMTLPSDKLFVFYHTSASGKACKPSLAIGRILTLLPKTQIKQYLKLDEKDKLMSKKLIFESIFKLKPSTQAALYSIFENDPDYIEILERLKTPVSDTECNIDPVLASEIFGEKMSLTTSRIEKYVKCHFLYYCNYILKLRGTETASFNYGDMGNFIHKILENFMYCMVDENGIKKTFSQDEIKNAVEEETEKYIRTLFDGRFPPSKRLLHHLTRLKRLAILVATDLYNEIIQSDFTPKFFEMKIGRGTSSALPAHEILLKDGTKVLINGQVDRVDICKKDNTVFIKIVDYKTGSKSFSVSDIEKGLNTQLLLYLFAICNTTSESFKEAVNCTSADTLKPAGIMYISTNVSPVNVSGEATDEEIFKMASDKITRNGLILNDNEVIEAINQCGNSKYLLNAKIDSQGNFSGKSLASLEDFQMLENLINETVAAIATEMRSGNASAIPLSNGNSLPCDYCNMKQFCRADRTQAATADKATEDTTEEE